MTAPTQPLDSPDTSPAEVRAALIPEQPGQGTLQVEILREEQHDAVTGAGVLEADAVKAGGLQGLRVFVTLQPPAPEQDLLTQGGEQH